ncbi:MAG TPA: HAD family hydrolase [Thermoplasmata archaeon]|nr:HAD family hydrolase [Thermoplasmata archaeon]
MPIPSGAAPVDAVLFDLDDVLVPFHALSVWQWAWKPQGPALGPRRAAAAFRRAVHAWDKRRWDGVTGRQPPADATALRTHLVETLEALAARPLPAEEVEAVVRRVLHPAGEVERFPDVAPCLARLAAAHVRYGISTSLPGDSARWLLKRVGLPEAALLATGDGPDPALPARAAFKAAVARLDVPAERVVYVGDLFWSDVHAAHRAGVPALLLDRPDSWPRVALGRMRSLDALESTLAAHAPGTGGPGPGDAAGGEPI